MPDPLLGLQIDEDSIFLPGDIGDVLHCRVLDKIAPDDALEGDVSARVVELVWREVW